MCNNNAIKTFPLPANKEKKKSTPAYYQCLLNESLNNFHGQKITQACKNCKQNSANLANERDNQVQVLMTAYSQMGECLRNLLTPLTND
jgi:hypothetical protein